MLDVGSGPGDYHSRLGHARVVAVDLSAGMLARVRVPAARADAQALPFRDRGFDRVMANYVLHHVPDLRAALREMRRVTRTGGRVVITANGRDNLAPLFDLQNAVARELGIAEEHSVGLRFGIEDLEVVRSVLPQARVVVRDDALVFRSVEPVLAYVASSSIGVLPPDRRAAFLDRLADRIGPLIARDGVFRVPKRVGCFFADV